MLFLLSRRGWRALLVQLDRLRCKTVTALAELDRDDGWNAEG